MKMMLKQRANEFEIETRRMNVLGYRREMAKSKRRQLLARRSIAYILNDNHHKSLKCITMRGEEKSND